MVSTVAVFSLHQTSALVRKGPCNLDQYPKVTISLARPEFRQAQNECTAEDSKKSTADNITRKVQPQNDHRDTGSDSEKNEGNTPSSIPRPYHCGDCKRVCRMSRWESRISGGFTTGHYSERGHLERSWKVEGSFQHVRETHCSHHRYGQ